MSVRVADVVDAIHDAFPAEWAESWDRVGLLAGDPAAEVSKVLVSLDPTPAALERARQAGARALVTHHPVFLEPPATLTPRGAGVAFAALDAGIALIAAHTNLDRAPRAAAALPHLLGLDPGRPLEDAHLPMSMITVFVPGEAEHAVTEAMALAGAGRIGEYRGCSFAASGTGAFTPADDASPHSGAPGEASSARELRLEMVAPPACAGAVVRAARDAHPYEEPLITVTPVTIARGNARMGRISTLREPTSLATFVDHVSDVFRITPRVWGDPGARLASVATATGSAGSLVPAALEAAVDVLVAGEVRYHDAQTAAAAGLCVVEIGHDVSEWPLVPVLASALSGAPDLSAVTVLVDPPAAGWWTP
ncbi:MAG: Nif3-like dinuclear metal center hexameric protein [Anaerosomatales bacterium]